MNDVLTGKSVNDVLTVVNYTNNIVTSVTNSLVIVSSEGKITYVNPATCTLLGYEEKELLGQHIGIIFAAAAAAAAETLPFTGTGLEHLLDRGSVRNLERTYIAKDGREIPVLFSMSVMREKNTNKVVSNMSFPLVGNLSYSPLEKGDEGVVEEGLRTSRSDKLGGEGELQWESTGRVQGIVCIAQDISERKRAEEELQKAYAQIEREVEERTAELANAYKSLKASEEQYRSLVETTNTGYVIIDTESRVVDANQEYVRLSGHSALDDIRGRSVLEWTAVYEKEKNAEAATKYAEQGYIRNFEIDYVNKEGHATPIEINATVVEKDGRPQIVTLCRDITERRKAEEEIRKINAELEQRVYERTMELRLAKHKAELASSSKSEFLANMSHEIRTPITGIMGMSDLMLRTKLNSQQQEYLHMLQNSANALLLLINDILDFSKIEAGKLELDSYEFRLRECVDSAIKTVSISARKKGLELLCSVAPDVPDHLVGDAGRLRQVLLNLLSNAIKFTEQGEVVVEVRNVTDTFSVQRSAFGEEKEISTFGVVSSEFGDKEKEKVFDIELSSIAERRTPNAERSLDAERLISDCALHFSIRDTGIGIPSEKQQKIFESFTQVDSSFSRRFGGTGLGLSISSRLVSLMGGNIWVDSEEEKGSIFHFIAQFGLGTEWEEAMITAPDLKDMPVLIVDDNATGRMIIKEMLASWGMKPEAAGSGKSALKEMARAVSEALPFKLVLVDAMMPDMDGFDLTQEIKKNPALRDAVIIMMSSADVRYDQAGFRKMGISDYLTKPVSQSSLLNSIMRLLSTKASSDVSKVQTKKKPDLPVKSLYILLTEDNAVNQYVAMSFLMEAGHKVKIANNGSEALNALEKEAFDLILMDVQMPVMDGFEATAAIREKERTFGVRRSEFGDKDKKERSEFGVRSSETGEKEKTSRRHIPIIAMTALAMKGDRERCLAAGMDGYVSKPIDRDDLMRTIGEVMKIGKTFGVQSSEFGDEKEISTSGVFSSALGDKENKETFGGQSSESPNGIQSPNAQRPLTPERNTPNTERSFDVQAALSRLHGNKKLLKEIAEMFLKELPQHMESIRSAIDQSDSHKLDRASHTLKGAIGNFFATPAREAALALEKIGKGGDMTKAEEAYAILTKQIEVLKKEIERIK